MNVPKDDVLAQLPDWAKRALGKERRPTTVVPDREPSNSAEQLTWSALLNASVVADFLPRDVMAGGPSTEGDDRQQAEHTLLMCAERVHSGEGPRWSLTRTARQWILDTATESEIRSAVERTRARFKDSLSSALREQLTGHAPDLEKASLSALEAATLALRLLGQRPGGQAPSREQLEREVLLRRILEPLRRMIRGGSSDDVERFYGRDDQVRDLREYVGVMPADSIVGSVRGLAVSIGHFLKGAEAPMIVWGLGGAGKTTLIAKFVLEHAERAASRYPFAYLDFDRATISARQPALLLAEMCHQVGAQFPDLSGQMNRLKERIQADVAKRDALEHANRDSTDLSWMTRAFDEFRGAIDEYMAQLESRFEFKRPFLLVFDTFEIVQYSPADVVRVERFLEGLTRSENARGWARLRLIISGRNRPPRDFLDGFKEMKLAALEDRGSVEMLMALAKDANCALDRKIAEELIAAVAKFKGASSSTGLPPLSIRLLSEALGSKRSRNSNATAQEIIRELRSPPKGRQNALSTLINGILVRRILDHVADKRVRALADPGLVVRRIFPEVIRDVMAMGTPVPSSKDKVADGDTVDFEPWRLKGKPGTDDDEAQAIFEAFKNEGTLVERDAYGLHHRQDLRQEMLPLIQSRRPKRFVRLHRLAYNFYRRRVDANPSDDLARAEAIYHGLWRGASLEEVDKFWPDRAGFDARLDPVEFVNSERASLYVRAKTGRDVSAEDLRSLPSPIAMTWLDTRESALLEDDRSNEQADLVSAITGRNYVRLDGRTGTAAVVARLLYRTGQWDACRTLIGRQLKVPLTARGTVGVVMDRLSSELPHRRDALISLLRTWVTIAAKSGAEQLPLDLAREIGSSGALVDNPIIRVELLAFALLGYRALLAPDADVDDDAQYEIAGSIHDIITTIPSTLWQGNLRTLRYAILAADSDVPDLVAAFVMMADFPTADLKIVPLIAQVLATSLKKVVGQGGVADLTKIAAKRKPDPKDFATLRYTWVENRSRIADAIMSEPELEAPLRTTIAFDHRDWSMPLGNALARVFATPEGRPLRAALAKQKLINTKYSTVEGGPLIEPAIYQGKMFPLAQAITDLSREKPLQRESPSGGALFPDTADDVAAAFLNWHEIGLDKLDEDADGADDELAVYRRPSKSRKSSAVRRPTRSKAQRKTRRKK